MKRCCGSSKRDYESMQYEITHRMSRPRRYVSPCLLLDDNCLTIYNVMLEYRWQSFTIMNGMPFALHSRYWPKIKAARNLRAMRRKSSVTEMRSIRLRLTQIASSLRTRPSLACFLPNALRIPYTRARYKASMMSTTLYSSKLTGRWPIRQTLHLLFPQVIRFDDICLSRHCQTSIGTILYISQWLLHLEICLRTYKTYKILGLTLTSDKYHLPYTCSSSLKLLSIRSGLSHPHPTVLNPSLSLSLSLSLFETLSTCQTMKEGSLLSRRVSFHTIGRRFTYRPYSGTSVMIHFSITSHMSSSLTFSCGRTHTAFYAKLVTVMIYTLTCFQRVTPSRKCWKSLNRVTPGDGAEVHAPALKLRWCEQ